MSDLRERVARELYEIPVFGVSGVGFPAWNDVTHEIREHYLNMADAAIALALEEAAKVCDEHAARYEKDIEKGDDDGTLQSVAASLRGRAAAIRAMKGKSDE